MSVLDLFRSMSSGQQPIIQGQQPGQPNQGQQGQIGQADGQQPKFDAQGKPIPAGGEAPQGLDATKSWFTPAETDAKPSNFDPAALFATTPEAQQALLTEVGKLNFIEGAATPEMITAIQAGGDDAVKALPALMNKVAQNAFAAALKASMQISQTAFAKAAPAIEGKMNDTINRRRITEAVTTANPVLSHPSGKIIADALIDSFAKKYPTASETELKELANKYITDISTVGMPQPATDKKSASKMETDWSTFMSPN